MLKQLATISQQGPASHGRLVIQLLLLMDGSVGLADLQESAEDLRKAIARISPSTGSVFLATSGNAPTASLLLYAFNGALDCTEITAADVLHSPAELEGAAGFGAGRAQAESQIYRALARRPMATHCMAMPGPLCSATMRTTA